MENKYAHWIKCEGNNWRGIVSELLKVPLMCLQPERNCFSELTQRNNSVMFQGFFAGYCNAQG